MRLHHVLVAILALLVLPLYTIFTISIPDGCHQPARVRFQNEISLPNPPPNPNLKVMDAMFDGVSVRIYQPVPLPPDGAGVVYYHGGGWVLGDVEMFDDVLRLVAEEAPAVVVSVNYRLAPEYPYPVPREDCEAATKYFLHHARDYGVNPHRIIIAGDSAGGNLAASVSLSLRNEKFYPQPKLQILIYPILQAVDFNLPSYQTHEFHPFASKKSCIACWLRYGFGNVNNLWAVYKNQHTTRDVKKEMREKYLRLDEVGRGMIGDGDREEGDRVEGYSHEGNVSLWLEVRERLMDPLYAPLMADDLTDLPATLMVTVDHDPLRDDGILYAQRLREAGINIKHRHYTYMMHGVFSLVRLIDAAIMRHDIIKYIQHNV